MDTINIPSCRSDACRQGRAPCPTPCACGLPDDDCFGAARGVVLAVPVALLIWLALALAWAAVRWHEEVIAFLAGLLS